MDLHGFIFNGAFIDIMHNILKQYCAVLQKYFAMKKNRLLDCIISEKSFRKGSITMKKTIAKIAAAALAVTLTAAVLPAAAVMPVYAVSGSTTSNESEVEMKTALTKVKQRVKIPAELTEFTYSTGKSYGTKVYEFIWRNKNAGNDYREISVSIVGDVITSYRDSKASAKYSQDPTFAKLSEKQILAKAEGYIKQLNPKTADQVKTEVSRLNLLNSTATVSFTRYVNGVEVNSNSGTVTLDKDTGALSNFSVSWWDNADFPSPKSALTEKEIKEEYKKLCNLTPYYGISTDWSTGKKTATIVYEPDFTSEIDAFKGEPSTIWQDMQSAGGTRFYGYEAYDTTASAALDEDDALEEDNDAGTGGVTFSQAELKKIQLDKNLITPEKAFEALKKDKYAALTDDYVISSYDVYSEKSDYPVPLIEEENSDTAKKEKEEEFFLNISFRVKDELKKTFNGYKNINVSLNAKTGELLSMSKYSNSSALPKLDVGEANAVADAAAKQYAKDMYAKCKPNAENSAEVKTWSGGFETARRFVFDRYVNGIRVNGDRVSVTVDSVGTVTSYNSSWTEDVKFPSAKILSADEAFDKLYAQRDFNYYYTGWITKDGKVKVYLLYRMDGFYLNAKTGKLCSWNGGEPWSYNDGRSVKYTDIKGIPQEQAILTLQKYGVTLTTDSKFKPNEAITKEEFQRLLSSTVGGYYAYDVEDIDEAEIVQDDEETAKKPAGLTRTEAAVIFSGRFDNGNILKLKGIYKTPFSDVKNSDENAGYIAVAYAKGFIPKGNGKFGGSKTITRAEAMQMIYDYVKSDKK